MKLKTIPIKNVRMKLEDELSTHVESLQLSNNDSTQFFTELVENLETAGIIGDASEV